MRVLARDSLSMYRGIHAEREGFDEESQKGSLGLDVSGGRLLGYDPRRERQRDEVLAGVVVPGV